MLNLTPYYNIIFIAITYIAFIAFIWFPKYKNLYLLFISLALAILMLAKFDWYIFVHLSAIGALISAITLLLHNERAIIYKLIIACTGTMMYLLILDISKSAQYIANLFFLMILVLIAKEVLFENGN